MTRTKDRAYDIETNTSENHCISNFRASKHAKKKYKIQEVEIQEQTQVWYRVDKEFIDRKKG